MIFQHFTSKEKLFEAVIKASYGRQPLKEKLNGRLPTDVDDEVFRTIAAHNFRYAREPQGREMMRFLTYLSLETPSLFRQHLLDEGAEVIELITDIIAEQIAAGVFKEINPRIAAYAFLGMIRNYLWNAHVLEEAATLKFPDDEVIDTFIQIFFDGIRR